MLKDVLKTCLGIRNNEAVLIVTDDNEVEIAAKLERAARRLSNEVIVVKMKPRSHHAEEPPKIIAEAMKSSDVVIMPTTMSLTHTDAKKDACKKGARIASMPGITMQMLKRGAMLADYGEVKAKSVKIAKMLNKAKEIKIATAGCDFKADVSKRKAVADSGIMTKKGACGNLPAGEGFIAPVEGKSQGKLVFDGSFGGVGVLKKPLRLIIEKGRVVKCEGEKGKLARIFKKYKNADCIAEIGIGTNPKARIIGNVLEDEKVWGTAHVALGDNHTFGGKTRAEVHLDGIIKKPSIWLDGKEIMKEGEFLCFQ